jgi:hypothetical protein
VRRLLQLVSGVFIVLSAALCWRIVEVFQVEPPTFGQPVVSDAGTPLPPAPRHRAVSGATIDAIVDGNLFETERGYREEEGGDADVSEEPLPPPTNIALNGVFVFKDDPMAIVTDSGAGNRQLTLHVGDNVGEYQVGEITAQRVTLLGRSGQQFSLELDIKKGATVPVRTPARPVPGARPGARVPAGPPPRSQTAAQRAQAARAAQAQRAQAAQASRAAARARAAAGRAAATGAPKDPTQQRLEALRRLREAAAAR